MALLLGPATGEAAGRLDPVLRAWMAAATDSSATRAVWVMLRYASDEGRPALSPRALARRVRRAPASLGDLLDRPLAAADVAALEAAGLAPRQRSRWLRAVSGTVTSAALARVAAMPQVVQVRPVLQWRRTVSIDQAGGAGTGVEREMTPLPGAPQPLAQLTASQNASLDIDDLQARGYHGEGMVIAMLDTGATTHHPALAAADVLATYDFIHHDPVIDNESGQDLSTQRNHGTSTWSVIAGYQPGVFEGGAYRASFALGKTEDIATETPVEEDNWVAGIEWADSLGADVLSSSLGYNTFDDGSGYTRADLDGDTALATRAADMAVARGLVVVSAMGNAGASAWQKMLVPADGDSVFSIGAVDSLGALAAFSSRGPTADGRVKPDFVARGINVVTVNPVDTLGYGYLSGTSLATPLVASLCALLLQAHPDWTPMQLREALRASADRAASPDTLYGWGVPAGLTALGYESTGIAPPGGGGEARGQIVALGVPARQRLTWWVSSTDGATTVTPASLDICTVSGRSVRRIPFLLPPVTRRTARHGGRQALVSWDLRDATGRRVPAGRYFAVVRVGAHAIAGSALVH